MLGPEASLEERRVRNKMLQRPNPAIARMVCADAWPATDGPCCPGVFNTSACGKIGLDIFRTEAEAPVVVQRARVVRGPSARVAAILCADVMGST